MRRILLAATIALMSSANANANPNPDTRLTMAVIEGQIGSREILAGKYERATVVAERRRKLRSPWDFAVHHSNLCVAYLKSKRMAMAEAACARAVDSLDNVRGVRRRTSQYKTDIAVVRNNRGVVRAINGDADGATADFEFAERGLAKIARRNQAALKASLGSGAIAAATVN